MAVTTKLKLLLVFVNFLKICTCEFSEWVDEDFYQLKDNIFWPNATVPFYIDPNHFDDEQTLSILRSLALFGFRTCIRFVPTLVKPEGNSRVMLLENPEGQKTCYIDDRGFNVYGPHSVVLGYSCLSSPNIEMIIMRTLGFPFEHNRITRDNFISVQEENVQPMALELFTRDNKLPAELHKLPYDYISVMHFDTRQFSKNGHRTIIFKDDKVRQSRKGLSPLDLRKIELVYGPECRARDRREKMELCQNQPGAVRRKREAEEPAEVTESIPVDGTTNLRVNRDITPPPDVAVSMAPEDAAAVLKELGIEAEVQEIVDQVHKVTELALKNARLKYCNDSKLNLRDGTEVKESNTTDVIAVVQTIADFAKSIVVHATTNLTAFCESPKSLDEYQRSCDFSGPNCPRHYRSTRFGNVRQSTQFRPYIRQSTKHWPLKKKNWLRATNDTDDETTDAAAEEKPGNVTESSRRKREVEVLASENPKPAANVEANSTEANVTLKEEKVTATEDKTGPSKETIPDKVTAAQSDSKATTGASDVKKAELKGDKPNQRRRRAYSDNSPDSSESAMSLQKPSTNRRSPDSDGDDVLLLVVPLRRSQGKWKPISPPDLKKGKDGEEQQKNLRRRFSAKKKKVKPSEVEQAEDEEEDEEDEIRFSAKKKKVKPSEVEPVEEEEAEDEIVDQQPSKKPRSARGPKPRTVKLSQKNKEFYGDRRWPKGVVPYVIAEEDAYDTNDVRSRIEEVNAILKAKTCVRLKEISAAETKKYQDHVVLDSSPDYVTGHVGGKQTFGVLELFEGGQHRQHAAMVVMAMLGFYFEVARHDRDQYIRVHPRHIRPDKLHHFEKIRADATFPLPYDFKSATHPSWQFWRAIGKSGISSVATYKEKDPDGTLMKSLGQNEELLSELDLVKINSVYGTRCFKQTAL